MYGPISRYDSSKIVHSKPSRRIIVECAIDYDVLYGRKNRADSSICASVMSALCTTCAE